METMHEQGLWVASQEIQRGAWLLLQAAVLAEEVGRDLWDFAVEIATLHSVGVSNSDLRWMICKGFIEHGHEVTEPLKSGRRFHSHGDFSLGKNSHGELSLNNRSCFILTTKGHRFVRQILPNAAAGLPERRLFNEPNSTIPSHLARNGSPDLRGNVHIARPIWDAGRHQLRVGEVIVKEYKLPSPNQETILAAFEEESWPPYVDDPLPVHPDLEPKRRLHDTIKSLNRNQRSYLIRFMGNGTGEGIRWEWVKRMSADCNV